MEETFHGLLKKEGFEVGEISCRFEIQITMYGSGFGIATIRWFARVEYLQGGPRRIPVKI